MIANLKTLAVIVYVCSPLGVYVLMSLTVPGRPRGDER